MPDSDLPGLSEATAVADADVLHVVTDPGGGSEADEKVTKANLLDDVPRQVDTLSPSAQSNADLAFKSGYGTFKLHGKIIVGTDGESIYLRFNDGAGFDSGTEYDWAGFTKDGSGAITEADGSGVGQIDLTPAGTGGATNEGAQIEVTIGRALDADHTLVHWEVSYIQADGSIGVSRGSGVHKVASTLTELQIVPSSGTITGELSLIGIP